jgi:hypothetical protein
MGSWDEGLFFGGWLWIDLRYKLLIIKQLIIINIEI